MEKYKMLSYRSKHKNIIILFMVLSLSGCGLDRSDAAANSTVQTTEINTETTTQENADNKKTESKNNKPDILTTITALVVAGTMVKISDDLQEIIKNPESAKDMKLCKRTSSREQCEIVMNAFINKDNTTLKELFCDTIIQTHDLDAEFNEALEFINGNVVSYSEHSVDIAGSTGGSSGRDGKLTNDYIDPWIEGVITDTGNEYWIGFYLKKVYVKDETKVGIQYVDIYNRSTKEKYMIGEYLE